MFLDVLATITLHKALVILHVLGLVLGFGVAISIDFLLLRCLLSGRMSRSALDMAEHAAYLTALGLVVLWLTGFGFLLQYYEISPEKLLNPKIHAKLAIVALLSLNGYLIHKLIMPCLWRYRGRNVLKRASTSELLLFAFCSSLSTISWVFPVVLGLNPALNFHFTAQSLFLEYLFCLAVALVLSTTVVFLLRRRSRSSVVAVSV